MVENAKKMGCGGCGGETFEVFQDAKGLIVECCQCKSTSTIRVTTPTIDIQFGEKSEGRLAVAPSRR